MVFNGLISFSDLAPIGDIRLVCPAISRRLPLSEKERTWKEFLKNLGALLLGFSSRSPLTLLDWRPVKTVPLWLIYALENVFSDLEEALCEDLGEDQIGLERSARISLRITVFGMNRENSLHHTRWSTSHSESRMLKHVLWSSPGQANNIDSEVSFLAIPSARSSRISSSWFLWWYLLIRAN